MSFRSCDADDTNTAMTETVRRAGSAQRSEWLSVEIRHLVALQAVADGGSFRRAAEELGYVQSAVSQQVAFLERVVGARLLERTRGPSPVRLTDVGVTMVRHADEIVTRLR